MYVALTHADSADVGPKNPPPRDQAYDWKGHDCHRDDQIS